MFLMDNFQTINDANVTSTAELLSYTNTVTDGWFGSILVLITFIMMLVILSPRSERFVEPFAVSSFITAILAILLRALNILNDTWLVVTIIVAVAGLAGLLFGDKFSGGVN